MLVRGSDQRNEAAGEYTLQGADAEFLRAAAFPLATRAEGYDSDAAVFAAIARDPSLAVVDESRLVARSGPPFAGAARPTQFNLNHPLADLKAAPWQPIEIVLRDPTKDVTISLRVIGIVRNQVTSVVGQWDAVIANISVVEEQFGGGESDSFYLVTDSDGATARRTADAVEGALLEHGVQAFSIRQRVEDAAAQSNAFHLLFQGFMGLGLIVGVTALGIIAFRSVAERRQQIGMLRAIGYTRRLVALSFFLESSFIALLGIGMGVVLGGALFYNLMTSAAFTNGAEVDFAFPWSRLLVIVGIAHGASALMTLIPARSASRVPVAEALRYHG